LHAINIKIVPNNKFEQNRSKLLFIFLDIISLIFAANVEKILYFHNIIFIKYNVLLRKWIIFDLILMNLNLLK